MRHLYTAERRALAWPEAASKRETLPFASPQSSAKTGSTHVAGAHENAVHGPALVEVVVPVALSMRCTKTTRCIHSPRAVKRSA